MFDYRIGSIEFSHTAKEFRLWMRISTLDKNKRILIPLHSYAYAERHLKEWKIKSFQIVYRPKPKRYEVHVVVEKEVVVAKPKSVVGVDLGLKRLVTAYEIKGEENRVLLLDKSRYKRFFIRMRELNNRIAKLQRLGKKEALKKLRHKRRNYAIDFKRKLAAEVAKQFSDAIVFIGLPKNIRNEHYKGSGNKKLRKRVNRWAFREFAEILKTELMENGNIAIIINEWMSTKRCSECGSKNTEVNDRHFRCLECGYEDDRDVNAAKNILKFGLKRLNKVLRKGAGGVVNHPELPMIARSGLKVEAPSVRGCPAIQICVKKESAQVCNLKINGMNYYCQ